MHFMLLVELPGRMPRRDALRAPRRSVPGRPQRGRHDQHQPKNKNRATKRRVRRGIARITATAISSSPA